MTATISRPELNTRRERPKFLARQDKPEFLTRREAAEYLGIAYQTMSLWAMSGKYGLPMIKVGRSVRYRQSDLDAWLERRTVGGEVGDE